MHAACRAWRRLSSGAHPCDSLAAGDPFRPALSPHHAIRLQATGEDKLPRGGYPDMGTGRYAALLPYASWYRFANAQRAHYNYVESVASVLTFSLLGGLHYPRFAAGATAGYVVGREVYAYLYSKKGPGARSAGALILDVALLALFGSAVASGLKIAGASKALGF
jgi:hypothetical protein